MWAAEGIIPFSLLKMELFPIFSAGAGKWLQWFPQNKAFKQIFI
jgi:hypothetical protein